MRAWEIGEFGLQGLRLCERPDPTPGPGQVVVEVRSVSLNFRDLLMIKGQYNPRQPLPLIPCSDGVGAVIAVGSGVKRVRPGERVVGVFCPTWLDGEPTRENLRGTLGGPLDGMLSERVLLLAEGVSAVPAHLSDDEAATLPCAALTAWSALVTYGRVTAGDTVLLQGTGGVSMMALQLCKLLGARTIMTSSSDDKLARVRELGADEVINYREQAEWGRVARELTAGRGVDLVVEVGGIATLEQSIRATRIGGTIALVGNLTGGKGTLNVIPFFMSHQRMQGVLVGHRAGFEAMCRAIAQHGMRPVIDRVFPFTEARAAFDHLETGAHLGKVCISVRS